MRLTLWERLHILIVQYIVFPLLCIWIGRHFNKIIVKGDCGRKNITYEKV